MRFIKIAFLATTCFFMFFVVSSMAADVAKIGVVDLQRILETSDSGKAAQDEITRKGNKMKEDLRGREDQIKELKNRLDREALVMSSDMRQEKEREYRIKINDFKTIQKQYLTDFKGMEKRLVSRLQKEIVRIVNDLGKKEGYLMIIEKTAALYYPNTIDVTDKVIQVYNAVGKEKSK